MSPQATEIGKNWKDLFLKVYYMSERHKLVKNKGSYRSRSVGSSHRYFHAIDVKAHEDDDAPSDWVFAGTGPIKQVNIEEMDDVSIKVQSAKY